MVLNSSALTDFTDSMTLAAETVLAPFELIEIKYVTFTLPPCCKRRAAGGDAGRCEVGDERDDTSQVTMTSSTDVLDTDAIVCLKAILTGLPTRFPSSENLTGAFTVISMLPVTCCTNSVVVNVTDVIVDRVLVLDVCDVVVVDVGVPVVVFVYVVVIVLVLDVLVGDVVVFVYVVVILLVLDVIVLVVKLVVVLVLDVTVVVTEGV